MGSEDDRRRQVEQRRRALLEVQRILREQARARRIDSARSIEDVVDARSAEGVDRDVPRAFTASSGTTDMDVPRAFTAPGDMEIEHGTAQTRESLLRDPSALVQSAERSDGEAVSDEPAGRAADPAVAESSAPSSTSDPSASLGEPAASSSVELAEALAVVVEQPADPSVADTIDPRSRDGSQPAPRIEPSPSRRPPQLRLADPALDRVWIPRDVRPTIGHLRDILSEHPEWVGVVGYDTYRGEVGKRAPTPWGGAGTLWSDVDTARMRCWVSDRMHVGVSAEVVEQALIVVGHDAPYSSLADEIRSFSWDGSPRLHRWLSEYMLADDTEYHREVGRRYLVQAVARAMQPGCKGDQVLVLEGKTGARKSSAIEVLAGRRNYSASRIDIRSPFVGAQLLGVWFYELPEMSFVRVNDVREVTGFISLPFDDYAPKNVKRKVVQLRTCVFAGTTEDDRYLRANTNRRFWPVRVGDRIRLDEIARDREQLFAEALWLYDNDYQWYLDDDGESLAREQQEMRRQTYAWEEPISSWIARNEDAILERGFVTVAQILKEALKKKADSWTLADEQKVADILAVFGWRRGGSRPDEPYRRRIPGVGRVYAYYPPDAEGERPAPPPTPVALCASTEAPRCAPSRLGEQLGQPGQQLGQLIPIIESSCYTYCPSCPSLFSLIERERERVVQPSQDTPPVPPAFPDLAEIGGQLGQQGSTDRDDS